MCQGRLERLRVEGFVLVMFSRKEPLRRLVTFAIPIAALAGRSMVLTPNTQNFLVAVTLPAWNANVI